MKLNRNRCEHLWSPVESMPFDESTPLAGFWFQTRVCRLCRRQQIRAVAEDAPEWITKETRIDWVAAAFQAPCHPSRDS